MCYYFSWFQSGEFILLENIYLFDGGLQSIALFILRLTEGLKRHLIEKEGKKKFWVFKCQQKGDPMLMVWYLIIFPNKNM